MILQSVKIFLFAIHTYDSQIGISKEVELLREISRKLSQLIILTKLSSSKFLEETKKEIRKDKVCQALLDLSDGSLGATQLKQKIMAIAKVSQDTVERRIHLLVEKGALIPNRKGRETFYDNSGLYD